MAASLAETALPSQEEINTLGLATAVGPIATWAGLAEEPLAQLSEVLGFSSVQDFKQAPPRLLAASPPEAFEEALKEWMGASFLSKAGARLLYKVAVALCTAKVSSEARPAEGGAATTNAKKKLKLAHLIDSTDDTEINAPDTDQVTRWFENYAEIKHGEPLEHHEPTPDQIAALHTRVVELKAEPYADFSLLTPYGRRMAKILRHRSWFLQEDGSYKAMEVPGPASFEVWEKCFDVYEVILLMLRFPPAAEGDGRPEVVVTPIAIDAYREAFKQLCKEHPECRHLCQRAEDRCRAEHFARVARKLRDKHRRKPTWSEVFQEAALDDRYWDREVRRPALGFLARNKRPQTDGDDATSAASQEPPAKKTVSQKRRERKQKLVEVGSESNPAKGSRKGETHPRKDKQGRFITTREGQEICFKYANGPDKGECRLGHRPDQMGTDQCNGSSQEAVEFTQEALRKEFGASRSDPGTVFDHQLWKSLLDAAGDPGTEVPGWLRHGCPTGIGESKVRTCGIFPPVDHASAAIEKARQFAALRAAQEWRHDLHKNYASFYTDGGALAEQEVQRIEQRGYIEIIRDWDEVRSRWPDATASKVALLVKTREDGSTKARIIIDLLRSGVNGGVALPERVVLPRLSDLTAAVLDLMEIDVRADWHPDEDWYELCTVDFEDAFHTLSLRAADRGKMVFKTAAGWAVFRRLCCGMASAPLVWGRVGAAACRLGQAMFQPHELRIQCFVGDPAICTRGPPHQRKRLLGALLLFWAALGFRPNWKKAIRGQTVPWIGAQLELQRRWCRKCRRHAWGLQVTLAPKKCREIVEAVDAIHRSTGVVHVKEVRKIAGQLSWASGLLPWLRGFNACLWAALAAHDQEQNAQALRFSAKKRPGQLFFLLRIQQAITWIRLLFAGLIRDREGKAITVQRWTTATTRLADLSACIRTDASPYGFGAIFFVDGAPRAWIAEEWADADLELLHATRGDPAWQAEWELLALLVAVDCWMPRLKDEALALLQTDATAALFSAARLAGRTPLMNALAAELALRFESANVHVSLEHVAGTLNFECDALSQISQGAAIPRSLRADRVAATRAGAGARSAAHAASLASAMAGPAAASGAAPAQLPAASRASARADRAAASGGGAGVGSAARAASQASARVGSAAASGAELVPRKSRKDFPDVRATKRPCRAEVLTAISTIKGKEEVLARLLQDTSAASSKLTADSLWATWSVFHQAWFGEATPALPLSAETVYAVAACFKQGGYRGFPAYMAKAKEAHTLAGWPWDEQLDLARRKATASVLRGLGVARQSAPFDLNAAVKAVREGSVHLGPLAPVGRVNFLIVASIFVMREIEAAFAKVGHVTFNRDERKVSLRLPVSKRDPRAVGCTRTWGCTCASPLSRELCPYCAADEQLGMLRDMFGPSFDDDLPLFPTRTGGVCLKANIVAALEATVAAYGGAPFPSGAKAFGGHSFRVTGAQRLAIAGMEVHKIMLHARWAGDTVLRYIREAPLENLPAEVIALEEKRSLIESLTKAQDDVIKVGDQVAAQKQDVADALAALQERLAKLDAGSAKPYVSGGGSRRFRVHEVAVEGLDVPPQLWRTKCGVRFAHWCFTKHASLASVRTELVGFESLIVFGRLHVLSTRD
ncbi:unnamed protein product [Prorocentrum cordatum]|uniref:Tyr recombinase domain-containing protein n=1 Tax=Prorocentrum cordatum TaxID=2364126 RepID=A0ABN9STL4_9DINO|nr:unnamed protein product [Polarella glacialis]